MLVSRFVESNLFVAEPAGVEVLDEASIPDAPSYPPRAPIAAGGLVAGMLLGPAMMLRRRVILNSGS